MIVNALRHRTNWTLDERDAVRTILPHETIYRFSADVTTATTAVIIDLIRLLFIALFALHYADR